MEMKVWGLVLTVGLAVAFFAWFFSADQRQRRKMRSVPRRLVREVGEGELARVTGTAEVREPLTAPLSGRACSYWRVVVEERRSSGKNSHWVKVIDDHEGVDFVLRDDTGAALVRTIHARAVLQKDASGSTGLFSDPTPELEAFLNDRGHSSSGFIFKKTMKFHEGVVEHGETVTAVTRALRGTRAERSSRSPDSPPSADGRPLCALTGPSARKTRKR
jgi:hypothetical protein